MNSAANTCIDNEACCIPLHAFAAIVFHPLQISDSTHIDLVKLRIGDSSIFASNFNAKTLRPLSQLYFSE